MSKQQSGIELGTWVIRSEEVLDSEVDGEIVMMSIAQGTYSGLDNIGSEIWRLIETPRRVSEICDAMMERYDVERETCERDVLLFLNDLASDETIQVVEKNDPVFSPPLA
ncbi:lasso peptide biosynthesis PqqD family chaperone [Desulfobacter vibrioformis]|uniref:lasso peptide biosynthesis PqqD family chaperone n=1 Tax=Desulfobacter vibrioformis TaxID=34031 RepID=UPI0005505D13|nr:lasso peptide biosynthesis PqqD family chaperone [Desulfobacter vibrioformis]